MLVNDYKAINNRKSMLISILENYGFIILICIFVIIVTAIRPRFLSFGNIINLSQQVVPISIMAMGAMFVLISGGIDLSAGIGVGLAAVSMGNILRLTQNIGIAILAMFLAVILLGVVNGLLVSKVKLGPIIVTLIMMTVVQGFVYIIASGKRVNLDYPLFLFIGRGRIAGVPTVFIILVVIYIIGYIVLNHTRLGFYLLAIGNNEEGARLAGINIEKYKMAPYIISGLCMSVTALILVSRVLWIMPNVGGTSLLLDAIAAAIIGGVSLSGGKGTIKGILIGSIAIALINNATNILNIYPAWNEFFKGLVIIIVLLFNRVLEVVKKV